jgi:hypothetical protein
LAIVTPLAAVYRAADVKQISFTRLRSSCSQNGTGQHPLPNAGSVSVRLDASPFERFQSKILFSLTSIENASVPLFLHHGNTRRRDDDEMRLHPS